MEQKKYTYKNDLYQPVWAYIPKYDEIFEYHNMSSTKESEENYRGREGWEFIGYGWQVYTYLEKGTWKNPEKLAVGQDNRLCAFFRKVE